MRGSGYGPVRDILLGVVGAFVGGLLSSFLVQGSSHGFLGSILVAFVGAVDLIALVRMLPERSAV